MRGALASAALTAATAVALAAVAPSPGAAGPRAMPVKGFLCDSAEHAIEFADVRASGESEEMAKDKVGRTARAEACGRYVGMAAVETEKVTLKGGTAYKVTAFRFKEDKRVAWLAERSFAPVSSNWDL